MSDIQAKTHCTDDGLPPLVGGHVLHASCLCGRNRVRLHLPSLTVPYYQCHCSLCRKQSGTGSNLATLLLDSQVQWLSQHTHSYRKDSGFYVQFCRECGTGLPNRIGNSAYVWLPLGTVDDEFAGKLQAQVCLASQWPWAATSAAACQWDHVPSSIEALYQGLWAANGA